MPPKGWRKDAQGNYPTTSYVKEQENITIDDLLFPRSVVVSLAKEVLQGGNENERKLVLTKDAQLALQRSATVFVNHLLLFARELAKDLDKKSCGVDEVLLALDHIGYPGLKHMVVAKLEEYRNYKQQQKQANEQEPAQVEESKAQE